MEGIAKRYVVIHLIILLLVGWFAYSMGAKNAVKTYRNDDYYFTFQVPENVSITYGTYSSAYPNAILFARIGESQISNLAVEVWDTEEEAKDASADRIEMSKGKYITFRNEGGIEEHRNAVDMMIQSVQFFR